jgi:hypothetical protein
MMISPFGQLDEDGVCAYWAQGREHFGGIGNIRERQPEGGEHSEDPPAESGHKLLKINNK